MTRTTEDQRFELESAYSILSNIQNGIMNVLVEEPELLEDLSVDDLKSLVRGCFELEKDFVRVLNLQ